MPRRPVLRELRQALIHVLLTLETVLEIPRIPRQVRQHLETLQTEVIAALQRNGQR